MLPGEAAEAEGPRALGSQGWILESWGSGPSRVWKDQLHSWPWEGGALGLGSLSGHSAPAPSAGPAPGLAQGCRGAHSCRVCSSVGWAAPRVLPEHPRTGAAAGCRARARVARTVEGGCRGPPLNFRLGNACQQSNGVVIRAAHRADWPQPGLPSQTVAGQPAAWASSALAAWGHGPLFGRGALGPGLWPGRWPPVGLLAWRTLGPSEQGTSGLALLPGQGKARSLELAGSGQYQALREALFVRGSKGRAPPEMPGAWALGAECSGESGLAILGDKIYDKMCSQGSLERGKKRRKRREMLGEMRPR